MLNNDLFKKVLKAQLKLNQNDSLFGSTSKLKLDFVKVMSCQQMRQVYRSFWTKVRRNWIWKCQVVFIIHNL